MSGFKNEYITVIEFYAKNKYRKILWRCLCKCGKEIIRSTYEIQSSIPKSCGCYVQSRRGNTTRHDYHTKHGLANKHRLYGTWKNMKQRCYNPNNQDYKIYGSKGIRVCDEWLNDAGAFMKWGFENGWEKHLTIDRIDSSKGYSPDNCRFITMAENSRKVSIENPNLNRGIYHKDATITEDTVRSIKQMLKNGMKQCYIMKTLNISRNIIWQIANNRTWKHILG